MKAYGLFTLFTLLISLSLAAPAQKSRRVLREDLSVQTSVPVGGGGATGEASPELHGTGLAPVSPVPGTLTAATGPTGSAQDTSAALLSAGRGVVIPGTVTAATAVTAVPTVSNDQSMLPALLASILGGLGNMGGNNAKAGTGTTTSNPNTSTPANTAQNAAPTNSEPAPSNATPTQGTLSQAPKNDQPKAGNKKCDEYNAKYKDKIEPPLHEKFKVRECIGADVKNPVQLRLRAENSDKQSNVYPIASGKIVEAGIAEAYGCRVVVEHEKCPLSVVTPNSSCRTVYLHLHMDPDKKECPDPKLNLKVGQAVTTQTPVGQTRKKKDAEKYRTRFEVRLYNQPVHPDKYMCAFTSHPKSANERVESSCSKGQEKAADTVRTMVAEPEPGVK